MQSSLLKNHKLVIAIVKKGAARKAMQAAEEAGAEGGTSLMAAGIGIHEKSSFLGIPLRPEKEVILILVRDEISEEVLHAMCDSCHIHKPAHGLAILLDVPAVTGICHLCENPPPELQEERRFTMEENAFRYKLIVTIVNKGYSEVVLEASKKAGARGGTILFGRGTGVHEQMKLLGITIEPEKEIVLTLIEKEKTQPVLEEIVQQAQLNKPGKGIAFILNVEQITGVSQIDQLVSKRGQET